ncbi:mechanosensitive ion channel family protein [Thiomicrospira pelophila]|uniref:mechanosensitive ion channel family protein n=1 Tax=Thiomicrospira pelophila TaxID=934 RepID=UPI00068F08FB|nr:mechanosensitive ion channel domain-containing protein [Thiomicrospira pelophila]
MEGSNTQINPWSFFDTVINWITSPLIQTATVSFSLATILGFFLIIVLAWWISAKIENIIQRFTKGKAYKHVDESTLYLLSRLLRYFIWFIATLMGLSYMGLNLSGLAFLGGAIGIGIGFGLKNIFSNFISGIIIISEKTLKIGDFVELNSVTTGVVAEIGLRFTRITTRDNVDIIVPNSEFINGQVTNWSYNEKNRRIHIPFSIAYGSNKDLVKEAALTAAKRVKGAVIDHASRQPDVWLVGFGDSSLDFELVIWVDNELMSRPGKAQALFLWELETELTKRGIEIPFPQRDLHLRTGKVKIDMETHQLTVEPRG